MKDFAAASSGADEPSKHFSSASVAEMLEFNNSSAQTAESQFNLQPQDQSQKVDAIATSASWQATKAVCGDLGNIASASGHDDDSDKEHNIGKQLALLDDLMLLVVTYLTQQCRCLVCFFFQIRHHGFYCLLHTFVMAKYGSGKHF